MPSSIPPIYKLSQDLIDEIIDVLVAINELESQGRSWCEQWKCLNVYSLISHAFLPRCNSYMFKRIDFNTDSPLDHKSRLKALHDILKNRPVLADYVQEMNVSLSSQYGTAWIIEDNAFSGVMGILERSRLPLQKFRLFGDYPPRPFQEVPQFVQQVAKPVILPFITFLYLKDLYDIPCDMVESCIHVTHLVLFNVKFTSRTARPSGSSIPRLNKLNYRNSGDGIRKFLANGCEPAHIDLSDLRTFIFGVDNLEDIECAQDVLNVSPSLEDLFLVHSLEHAGYSALIEHLDLGVCSNLQLLSLDTIFMDAKPEDPLAHARKLLSTISEDNQLVRVNLTILVGFGERGKPDRCFRADWESFTLGVDRVASGKPLIFFLHLLYEDLKKIGHGRRDAQRRFEYVEKACCSVLKELFRNRMPAITTKDNIEIILQQTVTRPLARYM